MRRRNFAIVNFILVLLAGVFVLGIFNPTGAFAHPEAGQSVNVAVIDTLWVINGGMFPTTTSGPSGSFTDFNFIMLPVGNVSTAALGPGGVCGPSGCDTVLLNVASNGLWCNINNLSSQAKTDLVNFVEGGFKLIIYDSECPPQDYSWLPLTFTTTNPGAMGAQGTLSIVEENTLSSNDPVNSHYINAAMLGSQTDAVGDMNVMTTFDPNWFLDMSGTNILGISGPVHTYAKYPPGTDYGLIIYNGLDVDYMYSSTIPDSSTPAGNLAKIWLQELQQPFNPSRLPSGIPVIGIGLTPASATITIGQSHTVSAKLTDLLANPQPGIQVAFSIESGPNAGATGECSPNLNCTTDANGEVNFSYQGSTSVGVDQIKGCFTNQANQQICSNYVIVEWIAPPCSPPSYVWIDNSYAFGLFEGLLKDFNPSDGIALVDIQPTEIRNIPYFSKGVQFWVKVNVEIAPAADIDVIPNPDDVVGGVFAWFGYLAPSAHASYEISFCKPGRVTFELDPGMLQNYAATLTLLDAILGAVIPLDWTMVDPFKYIGLMDDLSKIPLWNSAEVHVGNAFWYWSEGNKGKAFAELGRAGVDLVRLATNQEQWSAVQSALREFGINITAKILFKLLTGAPARVLEVFGDVVVMGIQTGFGTEGLPRIAVIGQ